MINSKQDYLYYIEADRIAKALPKKRSLILRIKRLFFPNHIWKFQKTLRKLEYYSNCKKGVINKVYFFFIKRKYQRLSLKLGFSIPINVFGPGLSIAHRGTIIISSGAKIGSNCRLHACVNIGTEAGYGSKAPIIGNNCYIGPGVKIYGNINLKDGVAIGANSVVNKSFKKLNIAIAGAPAKEIKDVDTKNILIPATELIELNLYKDEYSGMTAKELLKELNKK